jgi:chromosome partitioning protein
MLVLALAKTKGGVGSTTLAACLAVEASRHKKRVGILDCDPQRSLERWWYTREGEKELGLGDRQLELVEHERHLDDTLAKARSDTFDLLVIDGPPGNIDTTALIIEAADFILIASQPSPLDVHAMDAVVDLARESGTPYAFVLNRTKPKAVATPEAADFLATLGEVLKDQGGEFLEVGDRTGYSAAMLRGATLPEIEPKGKAVAEIERLWSAIDAKLRRAAKARARVPS